VQLQGNIISRVHASTEKESILMIVFEVHVTISALVVTQLKIWLQFDFFFGGIHYLAAPPHAF
jgi:hypothetical protein